eukprot:g14955.t1
MWDFCFYKSLQGGVRVSIETLEVVLAYKREFSKEKVRLRGQINELHKTVRTATRTYISGIADVSVNDRLGMFPVAGLRILASMVSTPLPAPSSGLPLPKAVCKSITWRIWATISTASIAYFFTHDSHATTSCTSVIEVVNMTAYYLHEKAYESLEDLLGATLVKLASPFVSITGEGLATQEGPVLSFPMIPSAYHGLLLSEDIQSRLTMQQLCSTACQIPRACYGQTSTVEREKFKEFATCTSTWQPVRIAKGNAWAEHEWERQRQLFAFYSVSSISIVTKYKRFLQFFGFDVMRSSVLVHRGQCWCYFMCVH